MHPLMDTWVVATVLVIVSNAALSMAVQVFSINSFLNQKHIQDEGSSFSVETVALGKGGRESKSHVDLREPHRALGGTRGLVPALSRFSCDWSRTAVWALVHSCRGSQHPCLPSLAVRLCRNTIFSGESSFWKWESLKLGPIINILYIQWKHCRCKNIDLFRQ